MTGTVKKPAAIPGHATGTARPPLGRQPSLMHDQHRPADVAVVTLPAEIDITNAQQVRDQLAAAITPGTTTTVIADLTPTS